MSVIAFDAMRTPRTLLRPRGNDAVRSPRSRWTALLAVGALALSAAVVAAAPATAAPGDPVAVQTGTYVLRSGASGKCLEVPGGSTTNGTLLTVATCVTGATNQQWTVTAQGAGFRLANVASGRCLDVPGASTAAGARLQQWGCANQTNQTWSAKASAGSGKAMIASASSGLCVSVEGGSTASGAPAVQDACDDAAKVQWSLPVSGGTSTGPWSDVPDGFATGVTGGTGGTTVTVTTLADLRKYASATGRYVVRVAAAITVTPYGDEIPITSDKTIIGVGTSGQIVNGGLRLNAGTNNVIIRNLTIRDTKMADDDPDDKVYDYDGIQMDTASNVWIDHNRILRMNDGLIDSRKDTTNLTVSWNEMGGSNKSFGIGWTENVTARMTIHHNWIHDTSQRNPSTDNVAYAHLYNNHLQNITSYGNLSRGATKMVLENSYFDNVKNPYAPQDTAELKQSGSVVVNSTGNQTTRGSAFDPKAFYAYTLDPASSLPALLKASTGPQASIGGAVPPTAAPVVAADGSGTYRTIQAAIDAVPANNTSRRVITIKPGTYREIVTIPANKPLVTLQGLGGSAADTVLVNNRSSAGGYGTSGSATFFAKGADLVATNLTIANDYGEGSQAVAANLEGARLVFRNVRFTGNQDTLLVNDAARAYVVDSYVEGTVDFIFGGGTAVFDRTSVYQKRSTGGPVTAARTDPAKQYGFLFYKSTITGKTAATTQLGRPWGADAQVLYRESSLSSTIATGQPWTNMSSNVWTAARFSEYRNTGAGAGTGSNRPQLSDAQAPSYTPQKYLAGSDGWNPVG